MLSSRVLPTTLSSTGIEILPLNIPRSLALSLHPSRTVYRLGITIVKQPESNVKMNTLSSTKLAIEVKLAIKLWVATLRRRNV